MHYRESECKYHLPANATELIFYINAACTSHVSWRYRIQSCSEQLSFWLHKSFHMYTCTIAYIWLVIEGFVMYVYAGSRAGHAQGTMLSVKDVQNRVRLWDSTWQGPCWGCLQQEHPPSPHLTTQMWDTTICYYVTIPSHAVNTLARSWSTNNTKRFTTYVLHKHISMSVF